ncbi:ABC transporter permease [Rhodohalobacter mucosus]|uniref:Macrolide ABC transporter permease n=1 Tax=Rhodohalobacter mucosus TaxID=2079485 RepID=A0A316TV68_9BACT|nr:ABC transporter permease [Rhodohalobacter mucosus]PWN06302.1 macrolide ABC transporter permease [Rhodohalobacter mucosus]
MLKSFQSALLYALENIRTNFFHTLLSVLGIIIGVSALIVILSMIDGLEKYAREQISNTTSVKVVEVSSATSETIDGVSIKKADPAILTRSIHRELISNITVPVSSFRVSEVAREIIIGKQTTGSLVYYSDSGNTDKFIVNYGTHFFGKDSTDFERRVAVVDTTLAARIGGPSYQPEEIVGSGLTLDGVNFEVIGIVDGYSPSPELVVPIDHLKGELLLDNPPFIALEATDVADVPVIKESITEWLASSPYTDNDFRIFSQDFRVSQTMQGFQLFRIIMGLIVGISVVVGGVGVMNVLLISVTQRTKEIGVRKAVGSRKRDIYIQFLSESMVISLFGTVVGILFGILVSLAVVPIVHRIVEVSFSPAFSLLTIGLITVISMFIGILFGTFPAWKASQLNPIDALRRE